ncbi:flavin-containing monooxygenase 5 isoform X1 [Syngnathus scovelli]|uniref:flavin-containing monooxygenase 5 isoform X1 n=1 Tax=Syngnathus scovelli TaxID=161590 RepID=UPI0035CBF665
MVRKVAVIGAGPSGLGAIKSCLEEDLQPTCFESSDDLGGLWKFKEVSEPNRASIYRSLTINISKEMMCYSDFPIPADFPNYMHHSKILKYFRMYADHFKLLQHIRFQTLVKSVKPRPDYARTGKWEVVTEKRDGKEETHVFDAVICCSGHYTYPNLPLQDFPGLDTFQGRYFHSWDYKGPEDMHGKRLVVIGIGNSGSDIATESSKFAEQVGAYLLFHHHADPPPPLLGQVYLSTRRGAWVIRQVSDDGLPVDMKYNTRFVHILFQLFPINFFNWFGEKKLNAMYDHTMYALKPKHRLFSQIPVINDDLPYKILSGSVIIKPNVKEIRGSSVIFEDGSVAEKVDTIVFATGYNYDFPYLPANTLYKSGHRVGLYKHVFPPNMEHHTLAVVGFIHALGAIMTQAEMQARWAVRVFKGHQKLPSNQAMVKAVEKDTKNMENSYIISRQSPLQVDFVTYMDDLADEIGARPSLLWLLFTDYRLFKEVLWGPVTSYQYRLTGPHKWDGARRAILTQFERLYQPLKTRKVQEANTASSGGLFKLSLALVAGGAAVYYVHVREPDFLPSLMSKLLPKKM